MKRFLSIIALIAIILMLTSCGPGKWVGGNARHFRDRADHKHTKAPKYYAHCTPY